MDLDLTSVVRTVAAAVPDREAIVWRDRRLSYATLANRANRLANVLAAAGLGAHAPRSALENWQSGQDHLAVYLHNGNEYLEAMLGAFAARVAPFNVNYRYVADELTHLLTNASARAIVFHAAFAPLLDEVRADVPTLEVFLQVDDGSGTALLDGAVHYEEALAAASPEPPPGSPSADDLYILYTGGTTGHPKGVLWRQGDIYPAALGGRDLTTGNEWTDLDAIAEAARHAGVRSMPVAPFMHGAAHWMAFNAFTGGNTVVLPSVTDRLDPADVWTTVAAEQVKAMLIVGDAFARPLLDELRRHRHDTSSLTMIISGGAALSAPVKQALLDAVDDLVIMDGLGSSETGTQARQFVSAGGTVSTGTFTPGAGMVVLSDDRQRVLGGTDTDLGWLAQRGRVPLGYLGDAEATARTFPVVDGVRYSVPGDRARLDANGHLELHGRDSVTINSGGEKIFAEEVEQALTAHPAVRDAVVVGRPSPQWGSEVVAVVEFEVDAQVSLEELRTECGRHLARYKLPKDLVVVPSVQRSPAGKPDYRWARAVVEGSTST
ncbi:MAG: acyl-CoA synthetase [Acidimicrobiia bacterium]|nr:acyl-CoA synthetase [Acidimicrobiia bacterium]